jgi:hypothetical protein
MAASIDELLTARFQVDPNANDDDCCIDGGAARFRLLLNNRHERIEKAAYFRAEQRGFSSGFEFNDWLEAEREVDNAARLTDRTLNTGIEHRALVADAASQLCSNTH